MHRQTVRRPDEAINALAKEVRALAFEYHQIEGEIEQQETTGRLRRGPLALSQIQAQIDDSTVLLEYSLGDVRSYLWLISRHSLEAYELPRRGTIEHGVRNVLRFLSNGPFAESPEETKYRKQAKDLSDILLGPIADTIQGKRLVVVPDGLLCYLAFGALPLGSRFGNDDQERPLATQNVLVKVPSATIFAALPERRKWKKESGKTVAVFADPVFDSDDPRVKKTEATGDYLRKEHAQTRLTRAFRYGVEWKGDHVVPRLPATRNEAEVIRAIVSDSEVDVALDFEASRAAVLQRGLEDYRIIHFATHAVIDAETPELSGIVLSLVDEKGRSQNGFLRLDDVQNLTLTADLVVLSACNTNVGKEVKGEGLIGLSHGFLRAGASSVLSTSWKIDDEATAALIEQFYLNLFKSKQSPATALRSAQTWMSQQERWKSPYYWAGFMLEGDGN